MKHTVLLGWIGTLASVASMAYGLPPTDNNAVAKAQPKPWNFMVYMVNNNNLNRYGLQNMRQMVRVGSGDKMNILLQMDDFGNRGFIRFFIERNNAAMVQSVLRPTHFSGTPENLFDFASWGIGAYPAQKQALVLWNHGAGIKDPHIWGKMLAKWRDEFLVFNSETGRFELDRSCVSEQGLRQKLAAFEARESADKQFLTERGIAFNDMTQTYLSNEDLTQALGDICAKLLGHKKLDLLVLDACHMAMIEVASQVKSYARVLVGSEEIEPGSGYSYESLLEQVRSKDFDAFSLGKHIVTCYEEEYCDTMSDYTQSAIDLTCVASVESNVDRVAASLITLLDVDSDRARCVLLAVRNNKRLTTEFLDTDYIDLYHFYQSLEVACSDKNAAYGVGNAAAKPLWQALAGMLTSGMHLMKQVIIANAAGVTLSNAHGLSIYFPTESMHNSYCKTEFARTNTWPKFLERYLRLRRA
jgi:hypothetical protein